MRIRTVSVVVVVLSINCMSFLRKRDLESRAFTWVGLNDQFSTDRADPLFDRCRSAAYVVQVRHVAATRKIKALPIVIDHQEPVSVLGSEAHQRTARTAVFAD